jgi:hypothetical protein
MASRNVEFLRSLVPQSGTTTPRLVRGCIHLRWDPDVLRAFSSQPSRLSFLATSAYLTQEQGRPNPTYDELGHQIAGPVLEQMTYQVSSFPCPHIVQARL